MNVDLSIVVLTDLHHFYRNKIIVIRDKVKQRGQSKELIKEEETLRDKFTEVTSEMYRTKIINGNYKAKQILGKRKQQAEDRYNKEVKE